MPARENGIFRDGEPDAARFRPDPTDGGFRLERRDGVGVVVQRALLGIPGVAHGFSTRLGPGADGFDLGGHADVEPTTLRRRQAFGIAIGISGYRPAIMRQVHGSRVLRAPDLRPGREAPDGDAVVALRADPPGAVPSVRWADCLPVLLADDEGRGVAAVHAGWRGTAERVLPAAVEALQALGVPPARLLAAFGPAIGICCYRVGQEVVDAVARGCRVDPDRLTERGSRGTALSLQAANRVQLEALGVPPASIHVAPWCTRCRGDLFFSHRGSGGRAGRQMASIGWRSGEPGGESLP